MEQTQWQHRQQRLYRWTQAACFLSCRRVGDKCQTAFPWNKTYTIHLGVGMACDFVDICIYFIFCTSHFLSDNQAYIISISRCLIYHLILIISYKYVVEFVGIKLEIKRRVSDIQSEISLALLNNYRPFILIPSGLVIELLWDKCKDFRDSTCNFFTQLFLSPIVV